MRRYVAPAAGPLLALVALAGCADEADPPGSQDLAPEAREASGATEPEATTTTELQVRPGGNPQVDDGFYTVGQVAPGACDEAPPSGNPGGDAGGENVPDLDDANCFVILPGGRLDPGVVESAEASIGPSGQWQVDLVFSEDGIDAFNSLAAECAAQSAECPTGQVAVVVTGRVVTAPRITEPSFARDAIQVSGEFTRDEADRVAAALAG